ncbi:ileal sodium/bile acid cotransporter-like [Branchiostoma lanceolatum]|uniref:ileal sodium/bile acid cotransporter-like n=1 Tax=Branchiostoma lanceolatum TaxID=7740 RepID=UPI00345165F8
MDTVEPFGGNVTNTTASPPGPPPKNPALVTAFNVVNIGILVFIMLAMGCTLELRTLVRLVRNPRQIDPRFFIGVVIGFLTQFLAMPLCGFAVAHIMQYSPMVAVGALVCTCCPGGTVSNIFTYWNKGDVALSVTMTSCSTVLAMGMMPLNLWIYSRSWTDQAAVIPYTQIVVALASILGPALVGMLLKLWSERLANFVIKLGSVLGLAGIAASITLSVFINPDMFTRSWKLWLGAAILPYIGFSIGFCCASIPLFKMSQARRRTVAFETGLQNVSIAYAIIQLTFTAPRGKAFLGDFLIFSILYGPFMMIDGLLLTAIYRLWVALQSRRNAQGEDVDKEEREDENNQL